MSMPAIVDQRGNPIRASLAYEGAGRSAKELRNWNPSLASADADLLTELPNLVARSRDMARNNGIAAGGVQTLVDNVIGVGLRMQARPDYRALGWSKGAADEWAGQVERAWRTFAETTECDAAESMDFAELTQLAYETVIQNGEAIGVARWYPRDPRRQWATAIMTIDPDRLSNPQNRMDSETERGGVEIDPRRGRPVAYHFRRSHPLDVPYGMGTFEWQRVPARLRNGRRLVIHAYQRHRAQQHRGAPLLSSVLNNFRMLDRYHRTELQTAVTNSLIAAFIQTNASVEQIAEAFGLNFEQYSQQRRQWEGQLEGGAIFTLPPGDSIQSFNPERPNSAFDDFCKSTLRHISTGLNIPYELLMKDFSETNYSSARAALLEAWRYFTGRRQFMAKKWCQPIYELWLEEAVNRGVIEAPDFYANRYAYTRAKWVGPGRGWVDPVKEAEASRLRQEAGVSTLEIEAAEQGLDWEEVLEQQAREQQRRAELGLPPSPASADMAVAARARGVSPQDENTDTAQPAAGGQ